jgi:hypothetical protein
MGSSTADVLNSIRAFPAEERRELFASMIRDFVARDGRDETIRLLLANVFDPQTPLVERQAETLAAFARLPNDVALGLLAPLDAASMRVEDCLSDDEVDRIVTGTIGVQCR